MAASGLAGSHGTDCTSSMRPASLDCQRAPPEPPDRGRSPSAARAKVPSLRDDPCGPCAPFRSVGSCGRAAARGRTALRELRISGRTWISEFAGRQGESALGSIPYPGTAGNFSLDALRAVIACWNWSEVAGFREPPGLAVGSFGVRVLGALIESTL